LARRFILDLHRSKVALGEKNRKPHLSS
jgi:hypothetical protein